MVSTSGSPMLPERRGAIEPYVYGLSKELSRNNFVDVFSFGMGSEIKRNLCIRTFQYNPYLLNSLQSLLGTGYTSTILFNIHLFKNIVRLQRKHPIDIFHIHCPYDALMMTIFDKLTFNVPSVCSIHNEIKFIQSLHYYDKLLAVSEYIRKSLERKGINSNKIETLPNAIDTNLYKPNQTIEQAKIQIGLEKFKIILFVGRKCPAKGLINLIEALPKIVKRNPTTVAILIGPDYFFGSKTNTYTNFLIKKAKELKIENHVIFKGFIPGRILRIYYNAADIFVCPSVWQEPYGIVVLEALAYEKPVVASNVGGIRENIKTMFNGLLVEPNNEIELANAISFLLENKELASRLGYNGRKKVEEKNSFKALGKRCLQIYKKVINE